jgi:Arc/MetJ family transcription regulator
MRTTLELNEKLLTQVEEITGETSLSKAVNKALEEFVKQDRRRRLFASLGTRDLDLADWQEFRHRERT